MRGVYVFLAAQVVGYQLSDLLAQIPLNPEAVRRRKSEFAPAQSDAFGNYSTDSLSDGVLAPPAPDLESVGQRHAVLDQLVIEQRYARLNRKRHGGTVLHAQDQRQRIDQDVVNLNALHRGPRAGAISPAGGVAPPARRGAARVGDDSIPVRPHSRLQHRIDIEQTARALREIAVSVPDVERVTAVTLSEHSPRFAGEPEDPSGTQQRSQIGVPELRITAEDFVAALPVEQNFHARVLSRAHHTPLRVKGQSVKGHILMPCHALEVRPKIFGRREDEVSLCLDVVRHRQGVFTLVYLFVLVAGSEGVEVLSDRAGRLGLLALNLSNQPDDDRGVEAAAQTTAGAHIADQVAPHRIEQAIPQGLDHL